MAAGCPASTVVPDSTRRMLRLHTRRFSGRCADRPHAAAAFDAAGRGGQWVVADTEQGPDAKLAPWRHRRMDDLRDDKTNSSAVRRAKSKPRRATLVSAEIQPLTSRLPMALVGQRTTDGTISTQVPLSHTGWSCGTPLAKRRPRL